MDQEELPQARHAYPDDHWLLYQCPWCHSAPFEHCTVAGQRATRIHDARLELVGTAITTGA